MRESGILMPIFSLAGKYGIGTLGKEAYRFVDFLKTANQRYWQILPIGPTGFGDSPYQSFSSYAGNTYFIDLDTLKDEGYLNPSDYESVDFGQDPTKIDYGKLYENRRKVLEKAYLNFTQRVPKEYGEFLAQNNCWLDDYAIYTAIKNDLNIGLKDFPKELRTKKTSDIKVLKEKYKKEIEFIKVQQFWFFTQWHALKNYANKNGIKIIGDIPIYVSPDSADLWAAPEVFMLDDSAKPKKVAGTPPDAFSADGQLWGNPLYDWSVLKKTNYEWWIKRLSYSGKLYDVVRIDHFRAFDEYFAIDYGAETARDGKWEPGPGMDLIKAFYKECPNVRIIAEDLGLMTKSVEKLLKDSKYPGMAVLQFAFDPMSDSKYLPHNIEPNTVVYTGTHDNDTVNGFMSNISSAEFEFCSQYLRLNPQEGYNWGMIKAAMATAAKLCIIPMQDFMGLGSDARINTPATDGGNWQWRISDGCINDWLAGIIKECTLLYRRNMQ